MSMAIAGFRRRLGRRFFFAVPVALVAGGALAQGADLKFKRSSLVIDSGGRELKFDVDLATNDAERAQGLMFRKSLGPYEGMLFDFYQELPVSFWMKNTLIPLDMIFIAADGTIRHVHANAVPLSTDPIPSQFPVRGVLEVIAGTARRYGIQEGDRVGHPLFNGFVQAAREYKAVRDAPRLAKEAAG